jgi:hypothetical protein
MAPDLERHHRRLDESQGSSSRTRYGKNGTFGILASQRAEKKAAETAKRK